MVWWFVLKYDVEMFLGVNKKKKSYSIELKYKVKALHSIKYMGFN